MTERAEILLGLVLDIKNNRKRPGAATTRELLPTGIFKWLRESGAEAVQLRSVTWAKLLAPNKKVCLPLSASCVLHDWSAPAPCLFDSESLSGHPRRTIGSSVSLTLAASEPLGGAHAID